MERGTGSIREVLGGLRLLADHGCVHAHVCSSRQCTGDVVSLLLSLTERVPRRFQEESLERDYPVSQSRRKSSVLGGCKTPGVPRMGPRSPAGDELRGDNKP